MELDIAFFTSDDDDDDGGNNNFNIKTVIN